METDLKRLRIDREARRIQEPKPIRKLLALAAVIGLLAVVAAVGYQRLTAAVPVHAVEVQSPNAVSAGGEETVLTATGYIIAAHKIEVASKVNGRVASINVDKGDKVEAGQVLVRLENDEYRAQLAQQKGQLENLEARLAEITNGSRPEEIEKARADVAEANADLNNAKISLDRTRELVKQGVLSPQSLDDAEAKYKSSESKVASLQRTLDLAILGPRKEQRDQVLGQINQVKGLVAYAQTQLDNTVIKAPVAGTILDRNVEKGEFVTTGFVGDKGAKGYLVTMADLNYLQVELDVSQNDFPKLGPQQKGSITTDAYPDRRYLGYVEQVSPEADRAKATVQVKVRVLNPDQYLRPDMNATVNFFNERKGTGASGTKRTVVIPAGALRNGSVFVAVNGRARKRAVTSSGSSPNGVLIREGLIGGEELIVNPPEDLKDGQRVELK
jgi:HlyD family secretion protein